jgi:uncharacterized protein
LPFLLLSAGLAAYAKASGSDNLISRAFQGSGSRVIVLAAVVGTISPFCSCGVIPVIAALLSMGVPLAPVMAFWLSSPLMDPSMFVLTAATLGVPFALAKTVAALGIGLLGGFVTLLLQKRGLLAVALKDGVGNGGCTASKIRKPKDVIWKFWQEGARKDVFAQSFIANASMLGKWLLLAFLLESLMLAWIPASTLTAFSSQSGVTGILLATAIGIPSYLNGYAALPLMSGLIQQGLEPGAAMAFLIAGGVTSVPAAIAVWAIARREVFLTYLLLAIAGAILSGLAVNLFN